MTATSSRESDRMSTEESAVRDEALDRLGGALDRLPEQERLAIHLYYLDPDPVHAASDALGLSRSGFYKLLARARAQLAAMLGELNPDDMSGPTPEGRSA